MKRVKCVNNDGYNSIITVGKVYDVLEFLSKLRDIDDSVYIINDKGRRNCFHIHHLESDGCSFMLGDPMFIDVTTEFRNEIIDEILS